jgi:hypothetical protein
MADPTINTAGMTDKDAKNVWYKALGGLSLWQVSAVYTLQSLQSFLSSSIPSQMMSSDIYSSGTLRSLHAKKPSFSNLGRLFC